ncbi:hypothetical protein [Actinokineospora inagensis]|uniref:hypothetical protein n=1 Tax=Actinokineospora inagensis TaxID=103730 RepID=UPI0003F98A55|nr:hypothetical protein [Actinokineospora inagensis]
MTTRAQRLARDAAEAARVRAYQTHPDVVALQVEQVRAQVDRLCWVGIGLGLAFTMANVQQFAAAGARSWSLPWIAAWLLDPTVSLVLLAILRAEQLTARYQVRTGRWVRRAKWFALAATYVMNTWASWAAGSVAGVVLHSVPPLVVFVAAEAITDLRDKLTETVAAAFAHAHAVNRATATNDDAPTNAEDSGIGVHEHPTAPAVVEPAPQTGPAGVRRKLFADYLADARDAWVPGVEVTPAWVRAVTGCSRGLSPRVAAALRAALADPGDTGNSATTVDDKPPRDHRDGGRR